MKNPREIASVVRTQTLAVEALFSPAEDKPLSFYQEPFSRLKMTIIGKQEGGKQRQFVYGNIPKHELAEMLARSEYAQKECFRREVEGSANTNSSEASNSPAYTVRLMAGEHKGKTPAEIMLTVPNGADFLNKHYQWLKENVGRYPKNKTVMDAIIDCSKLAEAGKLSASVQEAGVFEILNIGSRPLVRITNNEGLPFVYEIRVKCVFNNRYPISVEVSNYYAPVIKKENGLLNVQKSKAVGVKREEMNLSLTEWADVCYQIKASMEAFERAYSNQQLKAALAQEEKNRQGSEPLPY